MGDLIKFQQPLTHYMLHNFYVTTSGNFHTQTLNVTLAELGADRVLFSTDYPYESMREAADQPQRGMTTERHGDQGVLKAPSADSVRWRIVSVLGVAARRLSGSGRLVGQAQQVAWRRRSATRWAVTGAAVACCGD